MIFFLQAKEWKCQPDKFLTPENERHEILLGSMNMLIGSTASGIIACYIMNGGSAPLSISTISPKVAIVYITILRIHYTCKGLRFSYKAFLFVMVRDSYE